MRGERTGVLSRRETWRGKKRTDKIIGAGGDRARRGGGLG